MEWRTQPNPFRLYEGAPRIDLAHPGVEPQPAYDDLFVCDGAPPVAPTRLDRDAVSRFFYYSLALSAWKQASGTVRWSLRVNPSSGDLHPTEGYLIAGAIDGVGEAPALYHYAPLYHALERRRVLAPDDWSALEASVPSGAFLVGLTSIHWRESWKYGERAFRYCQHDVGHAIGALSFAAALLGWRARLVEGTADASLDRLLGVDRQQGPEAEHADTLMLVHPADRPEDDVAMPRIDAGLAQRMAASPPAGTPNTLSPAHRAWPVIDEVIEATARRGDGAFPARHVIREGSMSVLPRRDVPAPGLIRRRRSAVAMDGVTSVGRDAFYQMLARTLPDACPLRAWPWPARVALAIFVHRVAGLDPGLYCLLRDPAQGGSLRTATRETFVWQRPDGCPRGLDLYCLGVADARNAAGLIACYQQDIAATGCFALGMLAELQPVLETHGPWFYRRLHWETGLVGQALYLEAEAAGLRATGIGCFFDDVMHEALGITDHRWQSLYHFTVGGPVEDRRIQTIPAYAHLGVGDDGTSRGAEWEGFNSG